MTAAPDVTVMIAAWKAEDHIAKAIESALAQSDVSLEVIVVDDASPDDTHGAALRAGAGDARLKVLRLPENGGPSAARNAALDAARGRFAAVLDADDAMAPGRLARLVALADETGADIVADNLTRVDAADAPIDPGGFLPEDRYGRRMDIDLLRYVEDNAKMDGAPLLGYLKPLFRMATLNAASLRYDLSLRNSEDYFIVAEMLVRGARMVFDPSAGYLYRVHDQSISHRLTPELSAAVIAAEKAFQAEHGATVGAPVRAMMATRLRNLQHAYAFEDFLIKLKAGRLPAALTALASQPGATGFYVNKFRSILAKRMAPSHPG